MRAEHLKYWLEAAKGEEQLDMTNWDWVVEIIQTAFREVTLPTKFMWQTVFLIPKGNGY